MATELLPAVGRIDQLVKIHDQLDRFKYGLEPDGSAAAPWTWEDLD